MSFERLTLRCIVLCALLGAAVSAVAEATPASGQQEEFENAIYYGKRFFALNEYASAYENFAKADVLHPDVPPLMYDMALLLTKLGRYAEAQVKIDRYMQLFPAGAEIPMIRDLQRELQFQREVQKKRQADHDYREMFNRGKFMFQKGDLQEALKVFQRAEEQQPGDPAVTYNEAIIFEELGDYVKATEFLRRYTALETSDKPEVDQKIFALESEITDMRTKMVCSYCGTKLPIGTTWCPRCWHGPFLTSSPVWNTRACVPGATATRSSYFVDGRVSKNEDLPCLFRGGDFLQSIRYSQPRQREIKSARIAEGWTYNGDVLNVKSEKDGRQTVLEQNDYLHRAHSTATGEFLEYGAHQAANGSWLLDSETFSVDGLQYDKDYAFDPQGHISREIVRYRNTAACNHDMTLTADYAYENGYLSTVRVAGSYEGTPVEGSPHTEWDGTIAYTYDAAGRVEKEEFVLGLYQKTYATRPVGALRDEQQRLDPTARPKKPLDIRRTGDMCATVGTLMIGNQIDLRPLYTVSPNLSILLPVGVNRVTVSFTYPEGFAIPK